MSERRKLLAQKGRQLGDVRRDPARFIAAQKLCRRTPAGLILAIDVAKRLPGSIANDKAGGRLFDRPGRWESAISGQCQSSNAASATAIRTNANERRNAAGADVDRGKRCCSYQPSPVPGTPMLVRVRPWPAVNHAPLVPTLIDAPRLLRFSRNGPERKRR